MKIYDFETFKKNCKNIKVIKLKKWENITNQQNYNPFFMSWGKSLVVEVSLKEFGLFYFSDKKTGRYNFYLDEKKFKDTVEYVETNSELEIE